VGRNISKSIKRKLKEEGLNKIHNRLKSVLPEFSHKLCEENDLQTFLRKKEFTELTVTHHDKVHGKTWEVEYNIKRIEE